VRVMTALRHPNVVLFMAASTKAPKMCIVMEFMSLGSLFDVRTISYILSAYQLPPDLTQHKPTQLLHNELIPELPFALKAKMAYQASKGMHFLHSSGTPPPPTTYTEAHNPHRISRIDYYIPPHMAQALCTAI
jgi:serine/threonine protein kinase